VAWGRNGQALTRIEGGNLQRGKRSPAWFRPEKEDDWRVGPTVSEGRRGNGTDSGCGVNRSWTSSSSGPNGFPGVLFIFLFSFLLFFSVFRISFVSFAKMLQINSNHFQKFSKNQHNV
jgi:hypothetical protein